MECRSAAHGLEVCVSVVGVNFARWPREWTAPCVEHVGGRMALPSVELCACDWGLRNTQTLFWTATTVSGRMVVVCLLELFFGRPPHVVDHLSRQVTSSVNPRTLQRASAPLLLRKGAGGDAGVARRLSACPLAAGACTDRSRAVTRLAVYVPSGEPPGHSRGCLCPSCARFGAQATSANVC